MTNSKLKLNPSKTEFIIIGSKKQREKFKDLFPILLLDHDTLPKAFVRNLGFIFYCDFNFKRQISQTCKICFYHIRDFRRIRKYLSPEAAKSVSCALVTNVSHLVYSVFLALKKVGVRHYEDSDSKPAAGVSTQAQLLAKARQRRWQIQGPREFCF